MTKWETILKVAGEGGAAACHRHKLASGSR
jgi:hypothetical protein